MSAENVAAMAETYRNVGMLHAAGGEFLPMIAHMDAARLLERSADAMRVAAEASVAVHIGIDFASGPDLIGVYQPASGSVAILGEGLSVEFDETEAEQLHAALGDALAARRMGRSFVQKGGEAA